MKGKPQRWYEDDDDQRIRRWGWSKDRSKISSNEPTLSVQERETKKRCEILCARLTLTSFKFSNFRTYTYIKI